MKDYHYFIIPNPAHTNKSNDLSPGALIFRIPTFFPNVNEGDGPYKSIADLKTYSPIYKALCKSDTRRSQKIVQERFIRTIEELMRIPSGSSYKIDYIQLFEHIGGRFNKGEVTGVHFFDSAKVRISKILNVDFYTGVWEASIEYYNKKTGTWVKKQKPSTFFPIVWSKEVTFSECNYAFEKRTKEASSNSVYRATTKSGIPVKIIIVEGRVKSLYPILLYN